MDAKKLLASTSARMPVGKYKGQDLQTVMLSDPDYIRWITQQAWFREQHVHAYNIIINGIETEETPEHNALQIRFLEGEVRVHLVCLLLPEPKKATIRQQIFDHFHPGWCSGRGDETAEDIASNDRANRYTNMALARKQHREIWVSAPVFEEHGIDVMFEAETAVTFSWYGRKPIRTVSIDDRVLFCVEVKPTLGDDYPAVLRQILTARVRVDRSDAIYVLVIEQYTGRGADLSQVTRFFSAQGIYLTTFCNVSLQIAWIVYPLYPSKTGGTGERVTAYLTESAGKKPTNIPCVTPETPFSTP